MDINNKKVKKSMAAIMCGTFMCGAFFFGALWGLQTASREARENSAAAERGTEIITSVKTPAAAKPEIDPPQASAKSAVLIDDTGKILYEKSANDMAYPASTTKIMTALLTLEKLDELGLDIRSEIIVPEDAVGIEGSSIYLKKGERISIEELLYGLMLQSGNDSATALAIAVGGSLSEFVAMMNERAAVLGCTATNFTNPSGLYDENHYTSAADLAKIAMAAMSRDDFRKIVATKDWQSTDGARSFHNKNKTIFQYEGANGIKIGFTKASGRTLVASAEKNGRQLIAVVLNDSNWFEDAYALMDYGFEQGGD